MTEDQKRLEEIKGRLYGHRGGGIHIDENDVSTYDGAYAHLCQRTGLGSDNLSMVAMLWNGAKATAALIETVEAQAAEIERLRAENDDFYRSDIALTRSISMFKAEIERRQALNDDLMASMNNQAAELAALRAGPQITGFCAECERLAKENAERREALAEALRRLEKARPFWNGPVWEAVFIIDAALGQKGAHQPGQDLEESGADALRRIAHESVKRGQENAALRALAGEMREALKTYDVEGDAASYPEDDHVACSECTDKLRAAIAKADELLGGE